MRTHSIITVLSISLLAGCANKDSSGTPINTPVSIKTAHQEHQQRMEILPIKQVLRPLDVLDVIFHIGTTSKEAYRIQSGDQVELTFLTANELSGTRLVLPDGSIEMPYVGAIKLAGLSITEAQNVVVEQYNKIIKTPEIIVAVPRPMAQLENLRTTLNHPATGMSREILVGADGRASFPLIGTLSLRGLTIDELRNEVNKRYATELGQIKADVLLKSTAPNQVYILGEVNQPGAYPINRPISVLEALTLAQGANPNARLDSAVIMRRNGDEAAAYIYDIKEATSRKASQLAYLQPDDLLYIPQTRLSKAGQITRQIADVLLFNGFGYSFSYRVDNKDRDVEKDRQDFEESRNP